MVGKQKVVTDEQSERQAARDKIKEELDRCVEGGCCTSTCLACFHLSTLAHNSFLLGFCVQLRFGCTCDRFPNRYQQREKLKPPRQQASQDEYGADARGERNAPHLQPEWNMLRALLTAAVRDLNEMSDWQCLNCCT